MSLGADAQLFDAESSPRLEGLMERRQTFVRMCLPSEVASPSQRNAHPAPCPVFAKLWGAVPCPTVRQRRCGIRRHGLIPPFAGSGGVRGRSGFLGILLSLVCAPRASGRLLGVPPPGSIPVLALWPGASPRAELQMHRRSPPGRPEGSASIADRRFRIHSAFRAGGAFETNCS